MVDGAGGRRQEALPHCVPASNTRAWKPRTLLAAATDMFHM